MWVVTASRIRAILRWSLSHLFNWHRYLPNIYFYKVHQKGTIEIEQSN